ncbi:hypothetical protein NWFMUON74_09790 [Nocardia wallacei]|uniref:DUF4254 domain-containing protein n=1 Tax=Nocardia wallacei TaxID=480035 RepID=A0A7G1KD90_9NOCA|nr:hypothetical protein NWFMUON74_09790 [Nocardia wallacei]
MLPEHPVLHAARELAVLHTTLRTALAGESVDIDSARSGLVHEIDRWVSTHMPQPVGAAYLHTESVGMVVERFAQYYLDAQTSLDADTTEPYRHLLWQRLAQLAVAYTDLSFEISAGIRKLPNLSFHPSQDDSNEQEHGNEQPGTHD